MDSIEALNAAARSTATYGTQIPATLAASSAKVPPSWTGGGTSLSKRKWLGFPVQVATAGVFKITLNATFTAAAEAEILVYGNSLGKLALSTTASAPTVTTPILSVGNHGNIVRNVSGTFQLKSDRHPDRVVIFARHRRQGGAFIARTRWAWSVRGSPDDC